MKILISYFLKRFSVFLREQLIMGDFNQNLILYEMILIEPDIAVFGHQTYGGFAAICIINDYFLIIFSLGCVCTTVVATHCNVSLQFDIV
jgi:hypothetical protein